MKEKKTNLKKILITLSAIVIVVAVLAVSGIFIASAVAESSAVGEENAKNFAFADVGVDPTTVTGVKTEFEFKQGQFVYDVEFVADGKKYELWIRADDGAVVKKSVEVINAEGEKLTYTARITLDEAKEKVLADAGLVPTDARFFKADLDKDDGITVYEFEFVSITTGQRYEYEIHAETGAILSKEVKQPATETPGNTTVSDPAALENAKNVALADVGLSAADVTFTEAHKDREDGRVVYEIEFFTAEKEYEYEIGEDGQILKKSVKDRPTTGNTGSNNTGATEVTTPAELENAKSIALADAGLSAADVTFTEVKKDIDDGRVVYDVEFFTADTVYDYEIGTDGAIVSKSVKARVGTGTSSGSSGAVTPVDLETAKNAALADAGLSAADVTFTETKRDTDDGRVVYEIEFFTAEKEYEYEIGESGQILKKSVKDRAPASSGSSGTTSPAGYISVDAAKAAALAHAGLSAAEVTFSKAKLDREDGITVYEIEFYKNGMEYEYTINATTGEVMEYESEPID